MAKKIKVKAQYRRDSGYQYLHVSGEAVKSISDGSRERVICSVPGKEESFPCALMPDGKGNFYIMLSRRLMKDVPPLPDLVDIQLQKDESKYGMEVPEELEVLLEQDEEFSESFHKLTPGKQRSIIHLISSPKRVETRVDRAIRIAENVKMGVTSPQEFLKR